MIHDSKHVTYIGRCAEAETAHELINKSGDWTKLDKERAVNLLNRIFDIRAKAYKAAQEPE